MTNYLVREAQTFSSEPIVAVDIGARGGFLTEWQVFKDQVRIYCFGPDEEESRRLAADAPPNVSYIPIAVAGSSGPATLYETKLSYGAGLYRSRMEYFNRFLNRDNNVTVGESRVMAQTLDKVMDEYSIPEVDFIKVDCEGAELDILRGATRAVASALGILSEIRFHEELNGSPPFASLDDFLRSHG